jgi:hypothetical protein
MSKAIDAIVIACMFIAIYHNWTDFPKQPQVVRGTLITTGVEK